MIKYNMITPEGTKDSLFQECIIRRDIEGKSCGIFRERGYHEVVTPGIEYYDVFDLAGAAIPQHEMYKSTDHRGRLVVFRPDLTLPIARLAATRLKNHEKPIRLYYNQTIYRNRPDLSGRSDESTQTGIELLGIDGIRADLEAIVTAVQTLSACGVNFRLEIGHASLFHNLADRLNVSDTVKEDLRCTIESKNYAALNDILDKIPPSLYRDGIKALPRLFGGKEVFQKAAQYCVEKEAEKTLTYLQKLYVALCQLGLGDKIMIDLGLTQRNDYYTGVIFSAYVEGHGAAVLLGGRYNHLLEKFNAPMPAVGFGLDVDAVASILLDRQELALSPPNVVIFGEDGYEIEGQLLLAKLTATGKICENALFATWEETLVYAKARNIAKAVYVGEVTKEVCL
ncbi:MAG: ATP phosphoribosyltransferase regulatory subunit [Oscillospiraceae bacterium]